MAQAIVDIDIKLGCRVATATNLKTLATVATKKCLCNCYIILKIMQNYTAYSILIISLRQRVMLPLYLFVPKGNVHDQSDRKLMFHGRSGGLNLTF